VTAKYADNATPLAKTKNREYRIEKRETTTTTATMRRTI